MSEVRTAADQRGSPYHKEEICNIGSEKAVSSCQCTMLAASEVRTANVKLITGAGFTEKGNELNILYKYTTRIHQPHSQWQIHQPDSHHRQKISGVVVKVPQHTTPLEVTVATYTENAVSPRVSNRSRVSSTY